MITHITSGLGQALAFRRPGVSTRCLKIALLFAVVCGGSSPRITSKRLLADEPEQPSKQETKDDAKKNEETKSSESANPNSGKAKAKKRGPQIVRRSDLAASYLRFEQTFRAMSPAPERMAELNQGFDQATLAFFAGKNSEALKAIDALTDSLNPAAATLGGKMARSLRVVITPPVRIVGQVVNPVAQIDSLYTLDVEESTPVRLTLLLRTCTRSEAVRIPFDVVAASDAPVKLNIELAETTASLQPGTYRVEIEPSDSMAVVVGQWSIVPQSLVEVRDANAVRLDAIEATSPELKQALAACKARNQLLSDTPSDEKSAEFLADPAVLTGALTAEIAALEEGRDPYRRRGGDYWRVIESKRGELPVRIFAPEAAITDKPGALVIALHGAGGDENMFFDGYGAGLIRQLAEKHGFLVVAPLTYKFATSADYFDDLVEALGHDYAIDPARIYVLGHSMGGMAAANLAGARADQLAGVACLAGARGLSKKNALPSMLLVAGELDPLVPAKGIEETAKQAIDAKLPVELRVLPGFGHTLLVTSVLPDVVEWLLARQKTSQAP